jgi:PAS domain S-box-containing protein
MNFHKKSKDELIRELTELRISYNALREHYERDISLLKETEDQFRKSEELFSTVFKISPFSISINRLTDGIYVSVNEMFTKLMGYTEEEIVGKTYLEMNNWADPERREVFVKELMRKGVVEDFEARLLKKNGDIIYGMMSALVIDFNGVPHILNFIKDITEGKRTENELEQEQFLFKSLMDNLPDHIYFKNNENQFMRINKSLAEFFGLTDPCFALGKTDYDFFSEEHARQAYEDEMEIIRTGQMIMKEEKETHTDRPDTWVSTIKLPLHDRETNIIGTFGISRDITDRKQAEEAFYKLSQRHEAILASIPEIIMEVNNDKVYTWSNRAGLKFFGNDVIGKEASYYFEGEQSTYKTVQPLFEGAEDIFYVESWQRRYDGEKRLLAWWCRNLKDNKGNVTGALSSARDITERKKIENELAQEQYLMRTLMDNLPDHIYFKDNASRFIRINNALALFVGLSDPDQALGKTDFDFFTGEHAQQAFRDEQNIMRTGKMLSIEEKETHYDRPDTWVSTIKLPMRDKEGKITGTFGISRDISERKKAEEEMKLKNELLQTINAEKDKFFSILAHDLKGPLSAFLGATQILIEEIQNMSLEEIRDITIRMKESANNIYRLLENLLEWSRLKRGVMDFIPETFNATQKITECIEVLVESARKKEIKVNYSLPEDLTIYADSHMFETIIRNLVSNAIKFTPKSGEICVSASTTPDNSVEIKISDTGIGMDKELIGKLFQLNEKTSRKGTEGEPSTGLGLLLCKEFIEKHGGKIWVESEERKGSTFTFILPA